MEEVLREEVRFLRERLEESERLKEEAERVAYEKRSQTQDRIEALEVENEHLKASLDGKLLNVGFGDLLLVDSQKLLKASPGMFMQLAKKYGCTFVSMPDGGLDAISKLSDEQLEGLNLKKISESEKAKWSKRVKALSVEVETTYETLANVDSDMRSHLFGAVRALKAAYSSLFWVEENEKGAETVVPTGALIGGD